MLQNYLLECQITGVISFLLYNTSQLNAIYLTSFFCVCDFINTNASESVAECFMIAELIQPEGSKSI